MKKIIKQTEEAINEGPGLSGDGAPPTIEKLGGSLKKKDEVNV